jgi:hypothetical protein
MEGPGTWERLHMPAESGSCLAARRRPTLPWSREVANMSGTATRDDRCEVESLILRALVKKLVAKGVLTPEDVRSLLHEAVKGLDIVIQASVVQPRPVREAANEIIVEGD